LDKSSYLSGRRGEFGGGVVDFIPDQGIVWLIDEG
jgi:hypothetical protein